MRASPWSYGGIMGTGSPQQLSVATCKRTLRLSYQSPGLLRDTTFRPQCRVGHSPRSSAADFCRPRLRSRKSPTPTKGSMRAPSLGSLEVPWERGKTSQGVSHGNMVKEEKGGKSQRRNPVLTPPGQAPPSLCFSVALSVPTPTYQMDLGTFRRCVCSRELG